MGKGTGKYKHETRRDLAFGSMLTTYVAVGTAMANPLVKYRIVNETDASLNVSFDGTNAHDRLPANGGYIDDIAYAPVGSIALPKGTIVYVSYDAGSAPTTGSVYVAAMYNSNG